jgi:tetraacyldisaccharide 4'-kinase
MFSALYGQAVALRNALYDRGIFRSHQLGARTISIGNITTGGTGKTPLVGHVAELLAARGEKVCILTRGYGRKNGNSRVLVSDGNKVFADAAAGGDEPVELARRLIGKAVVVADPNRAAAGRWAKEEFDITAFVLDDGFQHRKSSRDLDIVCIDATDPFGSRRMLPAGRLREQIRNLSRAHAAVIMRSGTENIESLRSELSLFIPDKRIFEASRRVRRLTPLDGAPAPVGNARHLAFAGLGNPEAFSAWLSQQAFTVVGFRRFRDHHPYTQADIDALQEQARREGADALLTTAKDAVKLLGLSFELPCCVIEIELALDDPDAFASLL